MFVNKNETPSPNSDSLVSYDIKLTLQNGGEIPGSINNSVTHANIEVD